MSDAILVLPLRQIWAGAWGLPLHVRRSSPLRVVHVGHLCALSDFVQCRSTPRRRTASLQELVTIAFLITG